MIQKIKKSFPQISWIRLENNSLLGTPDLLAYNTSGVFFTVELKVCKGNKIRLSITSTTRKPTNHEMVLDHEINITINIALTMAIQQKRKGITMSLKVATAITIAIRYVQQYIIKNNHTNNSNDHISNSSHNNYHSNNKSPW